MISFARRSDPAETQGLSAFRTDFHRNLVSGTADTASLDFKDRHNIFHSLLEHFEGVFTCLFFDDVKSAVDDLLGDTFFTIEHNTVDETCYEL